MKYIKYLNDIKMKDLPLVGGKNASLGQMIQELSPKGIRIPLGFAVTADSYWQYLKDNKLTEKITNLLNKLDISNIKSLQSTGKKIRSLIYSGILSDDLILEIKEAYNWLNKYYNQKNADVAVRSSATAEDLPHASFAGQQETYLNIKGLEQILDATKKCMASLFTDRAIMYRVEHGFDHMKVGLSVCIQKMIRSDKASSGVLFTLDTDSGFKNVIVITSSYGLGENVVKGIVNPDEFHIFKPKLEAGYKPIIKKYLGSKDSKLVYAKGSKSTKNVSVKKNEREKFSLTDDEIINLAKQGQIIENHYSDLNNKWSPMDIEWAKDGTDNKLYILQARPETIHAHKALKDTLETYKLEKNQKLDQITIGLSIGKKIATGKAKILKSINEQTSLNQGDILVTSMTDPDWVPLMKKASAIITDKGGRTCHAAIVSRELGIPAVIGTSNATKIIKNGSPITVDCSQGSTGYIYEGIKKFKIKKIELKKIPSPPVPIFLNIANPDSAYEHSYLPVSGVGLARMEFIIANSIKIHPMAICQPKKLKSKTIINKIKKLSTAYKNSKEFYIQTLAQGIATIAAAFYPRPISLRLSDFKTNEYRNLIGGKYFEKIEENPMLGFRGASRYISPEFKEAFELECAAINQAINIMGFDNIKIMIPFVRTIKEAKDTISLLSKNKLKKSKNLEFIMMCEIPSNVLLLEEFSKHFDGFSIGSNDLTQFTLAVDRDSESLTEVFDERDSAVKKIFSMTIKKSKQLKKYITICGQAPSDFKEVADFLIDQGIDSLSLNPDSVIPFALKYKKN